MGRRLGLTVLLFLTLGAALPAQDLPVEVRLRVPEPCPACDCPPCPRAGCGCQTPVDGAAARLLLDRVRGTLALRFQGLLVLPPGLRAEPVAPALLQQQFGEPVFGSYGQGLIRYSDRARRGEALRILAHEVGHAWHEELTGRPPEDTEPRLREGFAEWVACHVLTDLGYRAAARRVRDSPDPVYGDGLRDLLRLEEQEGSGAVLARLTGRTGPSASAPSGPAPGSGPATAAPPPPGP